MDSYAKEIGHEMAGPQARQMRSSSGRLKKMKKHIDLISVLKSKKMRITPARRALLQFILDNHKRHISLEEIQAFMDTKLSGIDRSSIYRNLEAFKRLDIIQELNPPGVGKRFQYVFDRKIHHYFICKSCSKLTRGKNELFKKIERALNTIAGFSQANLSAVFYSYCKNCLQSQSTKKESKGKKLT
ncbi:MAG: hypothetical protein COV44_05745 [Deltaproteobacteria bacterium CG11_big_fil_rev_8_21_14_0_20_45_16]|nr:MAG: hypothetical protein COV44_05745 [Deltaproteobacteria bacterium CG11_big_fil_rev_8_21_14_0_20_45_16]